MTGHGGSVFRSTNVHALMQPQVAGFALRGRSEVGPLYSDLRFVPGTIEEGYGNVVS